MVRISLTQRYIKVKEEDRLERSMIEIMIRDVIKIVIDQRVEIGEYCSVVGYGRDRIIELDQGTIRIIEVTLEEVILEEICNHQNRYTEDKIIEVDTEEIIEEMNMIEVGVDLKIDNTLTIPVGMTEVVVDLDQVQEQVCIEIELDAISVGNMIILLKIVQLQ